MHQPFQPTAGSPILSVEDHRTLGYWTTGGPAFVCGTYRLRFIQPLKVSPALYQGGGNEAMDASFSTFEVWRAWGDKRHQVWLTTAKEPQDLKNLPGVRVSYEGDFAEDATALRRVMKMRGVPIDPFLLRHLEHFTQYIEARAENQARRGRA
jgi:hypothetical protein